MRRLDCNICLVELNDLVSTGLGTGSFDRQRRLIEPWNGYISLYRSG